LDAPILGTSGLAQVITAAGLSEASRVLGMEEGPAGERAGQALGIGGDQVVQWVERVRYADDEPLALDRSALAIDSVERKAFVGGDLTRGSLYGVLETLCGIRISGGSERLRAVTCGREERRLLRPRRGEGVFEVERIAYAGDRVVEWRRSLVRGGGYVLSATWGTMPVRVRY
jgi:GntR family transcriptional regulator